MGGEAASLEQLHRAIAPEAAAYTDAASVVQGKANAAAAGLAAVTLKDTMDPRDGRQYDAEYADSMAQLMAEFELQPCKLRTLVFSVLRAHCTVPAGFDIGQFVRVPSTGAAHNFMMLRLTKQIEQIKTLYAEAVKANRPNFAIATDGGKKMRRQCQDVTTYFWHYLTGVAERMFLGMPEVTGTSGEAEWLGQERTLATFGMELIYLTLIAADAGDSSVTAARAAKGAAIDALTESKKLIEPPWMRSLVRGLFRVPVDFLARGVPRECLLLSKDVYSCDDPMHKAKNAELAFVGKLGKYVVHPNAFRDKARKAAQARNMRQILFSFSRLFQEGLALQMFIRYMRLASEVPLPQVPRNIAHRLRIVTQLAFIATHFRRQILAGLKFFNDAYAVTPGKNRPLGGWEQSGVPSSCGMVATCEHVADVFHGFSCPRFRLEAALTAQVHSLSQDVYARTQEAGGLRFYRLRAIMREYRAGLQRLAEHTVSIFAATIAEAEEYFPIEEGAVAAPVAPAAATSAAAAPAAARTAASAAKRAAARAVSSLAASAPVLLRARGGNGVEVIGRRRWSLGHTKDTDLLEACLLPRVK